jgi:prevent-host-death family protein
MRTVNMHEAKTHLSRLVDQAANGEPFVIARAGKPLVQVTKLEPAPAPLPRKLGFLKGEFTVPDDIKTPFKDEIERMFYGDET